MEPSQLFLLAWAALIFWVLGQIWFCQIVVYPLFARVDSADYAAYHGFYVARIPLPIILPGFASFMLPIALAIYGPNLPGWMHAVNIACGMVGLLVTVWLQIPRHNRLEKSGKDEAVIAELIAFNWPRTLAITVQSTVTFSMLVHVFRVV